MVADTNLKLGAIKPRIRVQQQCNQNVTNLRSIRSAGEVQAGLDARSFGARAGVEELALGCVTVQQRTGAGTGQMGKGQRARLRKRQAKLGDDARRTAKRQRQDGGSSAAAPAAERPAEQIALIRAYHTLEKQLAAVDTDPSLTSDAAREVKRKALRAKQQELGGLDAYQKASLAGEDSAANVFNAAEWVLEELGGKPLAATHKSAQRVDPVPLPGGPDSASSPPLQLLDVGAIVNHYPAEPEPEPELLAAAAAQLRQRSTLGPRLPGGRRLHVTSIDLNAQDDNVIQADFFDFAKVINEGSFSIDLLSKK